MGPFEANQNAFQPAQTPVVNSHPFPDLEVRPRLTRKTGGEGQLNGLNLVVFDGHRLFARAHDPDYPRSDHQGTTVLKIELGEKVARKQRLIEFLCSVGPLPLTLIKWKEALIPLSLKMGRYQTLLPRPYL